MKRVVLASTSPRRRQLLRDAGIEHDARSPGIDDSELAYMGVVSPAAWVCALAYLKASAGFERADADAVVIGADTVVAKDGAVMGQPTDAAHAREMIGRLAGGTHEVLTGVAIVDADTRLVFVDVSVVRVGAVPVDEIERYVASEEWRGKAGAYNLADRVAAGWPIEVDGDPNSVMGLPVARVVEALSRIEQSDDAAQAADGGSVVAGG